MKPKQNYSVHSVHEPAEGARDLGSTVTCLFSLPFFTEV